MKTEYTHIAHDLAGLKILEDYEQAFVSALGVKIGVYKNRVLIRDASAWRTGGFNAEPVVMSVNRGEFYYQDMHILVEECSDNDRPCCFLIAYEISAGKPTGRGLMGISLLDPEQTGLSIYGKMTFEKFYQTIAIKYNLPDYFRDAPIQIAKHSGPDIEPSFFDRLKFYFNRANS